MGKKKERETTVIIVFNVCLGCGRTSIVGESSISTTLDTFLRGKEKGSMREREREMDGCVGVVVC